MVPEAPDQLGGVPGHVGDGKKGRNGRYVTQFFLYVIYNGKNSTVCVLVNDYFG